MTVGDIRKALEGKDENKNVVFVSTSGLEWVVNKQVLQNPLDTKSNDGESEQVVLYIK